MSRAVMRGPLNALVCRLLPASKGASTPLTLGINAAVHRACPGAPRYACPTLAMKMRLASPRMTSSSSWRALM